MRTGTEGAVTDRPLHLPIIPHGTQVAVIPDCVVLAALVEKKGLEMKFELNTDIVGLPLRNVCKLDGEADM